MQIMEDEFEVVPDDDSVSPVADAIMEISVQTQSGDFAKVDRLLERWRKVGTGKVVAQEGNQSDESVDEESESEEDEDEDEEMGDAPALVVKEKPAPQVDEDGFETVVGKRRR
jgi:pre-rRNA-processing protein TSR2